MAITCWMYECLAYHSNINEIWCDHNEVASHYCIVVLLGDDDTAASVREETVGLNRLGPAAGAVGLCYEKLSVQAAGATPPPLPIPHLSPLPPSNQPYHHRNHVEEVCRAALRSLGLPLGMMLMEEQRCAPRELCSAQTSLRRCPSQGLRPGRRPALRLYRQRQRRQGPPGHWCRRRW